MNAAANLGNKLIRIRMERGKSGAYFATSDDLEGLVVSATTEEELDVEIPAVITKLYAACGVPVVVYWVDAAADNDEKKWFAVPAAIAREALEKSEALSRA